MCSIFRLRNRQNFRCVNVCFLYRGRFRVTFLRHLFVTVFTLLHRNTQGGYISR